MNDWLINWLIDLSLVSVSLAFSDLRIWMRGDEMPGTTTFSFYFILRFPFGFASNKEIAEIAFLFLQFREILFVDETTGEKAFFSYKINSTIVAVGNYGSQLPGLFVGGGIADTSYDYQLLICDINFYSGFFVSGYTNCFKRCNHWCGDLVSPYFRSASTSSSYGGVAFNANGHRPLNSRLISVGLRWSSTLCKAFYHGPTCFIVDMLCYDVFFYFISAPKIN